MQHEPKSYDLSRIAQSLGYVAAAFIACLMLRESSHQVEDAATIPLFGWQRVLIAHVLLTLPLCAAIVWVARSTFPAFRYRTVWLAWSFLGAGIAAAVSAFMPSLATTLDAEGAGFAARAIVRVTLCVVLELPWCLAVDALVAVGTARVRGSEVISYRASACWIAIAAVAAIALPVAFAADLCSRQTAKAAELLDRQQPVAAERIVAMLCAVGSFQPLTGLSPLAVRRHLLDTIATLERRVQGPLAAAINTDQAIERARALAMLDRTQEACQALAAPAESNAEAALLLAAILQHQRRFDESSQWYRAGTRILKAAPESPEALSGMVRAYNGIAFNARETCRYAEAEAVYSQGLSEMPAAAAHFHFQLGRHHQLAGRPLAAIGHLQQAAALAPHAYARQAEKMLNQLASDSPGCVLGSRRTGRALQTAWPAGQR